MHEINFNNKPAQVLLCEILGAEGESSQETAIRHSAEKIVWGNIGNGLNEPFYARVTTIQEAEPSYHQFVYRTWAPLRWCHWRIALRLYIESRTDLGYWGWRACNLLYHTNTEEYPDSPLIAPILMDFLAEHPDRMARWEFFLSRNDEMGDLQLTDAIYC